MWKSAAVLCLLAAACSAAPPKGLRRLRPRTGGRIFGDEPVDISQYHWQVSLQEYGSHTCGGSIISVKAVSIAESELDAGTKVAISGWGDLTFGGWDSHIQRQAVTTAIVSRESCRGSYGMEVISGRMICAGKPQGGKDSCQGDSSGPLVAGSTQYGIVSWGNECALPGYPGVYTNFAALRSWTSDKTGV